MIDWLQSILDWYMQNVNYWSVLVCMTIESSIIPFPAELIVPPAAWKAANGDLNFLLVVIFSTIGSVLGALFNYVLAYTLGRKFIYSFAESRWGKILRMSKEKVEKSEQRQKFHADRKTYPGGKKFYFPSGWIGQNAFKQLYILHGCRKRYLEPDTGYGRLFFIFSKRVTGKVFHRDFHRHANRRHWLFHVSYYSVNT